MSFAKVAQSVALDEDRTPSERAEALAQLGDWNLSFGRRQSATNSYRLAYQALLIEAEDNQLAEDYFRLPTPVRFMQTDLIPLSSVPATEQTVFAEFSMTVTKGGRPLHIEAISVPEDMPKNYVRGLRRIVNEMRFRPRLSNGEPSEASGFKWQIPLFEEGETFTMEEQL